MTPNSNRRAKTIFADRMSRREFIKAIGIAAGAAGSTLILPGCGPTETPTTGGAELGMGMVDTSAFKRDPPWNVARSGMGEVNSWQAMATLHFDYGVREKYADKFGEVWTASCFFDPAQQVSDLEDLMTHDVDVLFILPATGGNAIAQIEEAMARNIPVILTSARAYTENYVSYLDRDNSSVGRVYSKYIAEKIGGSGKVAIMMGMAGNTYAEDVFRGVQEGLASFPDVVQVGETAYGGWSPTQGKTAMEGLLGMGETFDGIINDGGNMGIGIVDAYLDAGLPIPPICGDDGNGWLRVAKEHNLTYIATNGGVEVTLDAIDIAIQVLNGEPVAQIIFPPLTVFEQDENDDYYRPDLNDQYWAINKLPEDIILENYAI